MKTVSRPSGLIAKSYRLPWISAWSCGLLTPNAVLSDVIGAKPVARTEIVKQMWVYIKKNKLQDTKNKRMINCDEKLAKLFAGKKQFSMFDIGAMIGKNVKK